MSECFSSIVPFIANDIFNQCLMLKLDAIGFVVIKSSSIPGLTIKPKRFNAIEIRPVSNVVDELEIWIV